MRPLVGAYGKLPSRGDFVRRRLPKAFVEPWDQWLQQAIAHSREVLADQWLQLYLNGPIWRFVLAPRVISDASAAGVMMPSIDAVHRQFPLTLAVLLTTEVNPFALALEEAWFAGLEELALAWLDAGLPPEALDAGLDALPPPPVAEPPAHLDRGGGGEYSGWTIAPEPNAYATLLYPTLLDQWLRERTGGYSLWWTLGSDAVEPSFRIFCGLPRPEAFSTFFTDKIGPRPALGLPRGDDEERRDAAVSEET